MSSSATWSSTHAAGTGARPLRPPRRQRVSGLGATPASPAVLLAAGFLIGLLLGLPILGWWLWPVQTSNALPSDLAPAYREAYVAMAADSYALNGDLALAKARLGSWGQAESTRILQRLLQDARDAGSTVQAKRLEQLATDLELVAALDAPAPVEPTQPDEPQARSAAGSGAPALLLVTGAVLLGGGLLAVGYTVFRRADVGSLGSALSQLRTRAIRVPRPRFSVGRRDAPTRTPAADEDDLDVPDQTQAAPAVAVDEDEQEEEEISLDEALTLLAQEIDIEEQDEPAPEPAVVRQAQPVRESEVVDDDADVVGTFIATYRHGCDEMFDTSFNLETEDGEFLGECGVGVAETVGDASPEQACAMEIWLFDKGDIRTTTKLLVSDFALDDPEIRETLAGRGDMIRASRGQSLRLETAGLELKTEVIDVRYGDDPDAPPHSFFQELTMELRVVRKD